MSTAVPQLPLSAVVGQDDAKLALLLTAVDRRIGGVLLRGEKGSAKSTLARGLAALLPGGGPFVELPIGATEDRLVGSLDLAAALTGGEQRFRPGLLAAADGGVLYVDEINLLPDHLVDVLLDVAASGVNRVEREGISHVHPSRFLLIGSMNPEEGDLRPQLLDRFGLAVEVRASREASERAAAVRRRLEFDSDPASVVAEVEPAEAELRARLEAARPAAFPESLLEAVSSLCAAMGAEGLRADLTICRAAAALAGWEGRGSAGAEDVRRVAPLALAHRARRDPLDPAGMDEQRLADALDEHLEVGQGGRGDGGPDEGDADADDGDTGEGDAGEGDAGEGGRNEGGPNEGGPAPAEAPPVSPGPATETPLGNAGRRQHLGSSPPASGRRAPAEAQRGRQVGDRPLDGPLGSVAVGATVRRAAARMAAAGGPQPGVDLVVPADVREAIRVDRTADLIVLAVDASGSMGAPQRMEAAKGAVLGLLTDAYQRRDLVGLVSFRGEGAEVLLRPTGSVEIARARLVGLPTGGRTPLAAGITTALQLATAPSRLATHRPLLVLITDGRATAGPPGRDPVAAAAAAADAVRRAGVAAVVVDVEGASGPSSAPSLGLARELAERMGGRHVRAPALTPDGLRGVVRPVSRGTPRPVVHE